MRRTNRVLAVAIIVTLLVPGFVVGALVEACCGVDVTNLQVSDSPDPACDDGIVTISGTYDAYSEWSGQYPVAPYDTGIEIKVFDAGTEIASYTETLGTAQPDPGDLPGTEWAFSWDWSPTGAGAFTYEVIAWSETSWGRMQISFVGGTITVEGAGDCLGCTLEREIRDRWDNECVSCDEAKNHGQYVSCRANIQDEYLMAGLITEEESSCLVHPVAQSNCGFK